MVAAAGPLNRFGGGRHLWLATMPVAESPLNGGLPVANEAQPIFFFENLQLFISAGPPLSVTPIRQTKLQNPSLSERCLRSERVEQSHALADSFHCRAGPWQDPAREVRRQHHPVLR